MEAVAFGATRGWLRMIGRWRRGRAIAGAEGAGDRDEDALMGPDRPGQDELATA